MRRLLQETLILGLLCCGLSGCGVPRYGYYDYPGYGYAPLLLWVAYLCSRLRAGFHRPSFLGGTSHWRRASRGVL
jgi:hypothetical protein